ncbi:MAG: ribosome maturation factor RimM [Gammaproteobacteria bacterium]|nr:MAG: ribosome maturation factor RimM [Gammaproteobacteria bacterium]
MADVKAQPSEWLVLGKLTSAYGIKGWVKVHSYTEPMDNIGTYSPLWVEHNGQREKIEFEQIKPHGKGLIAKIKGCDTREQTPQYTGAMLVAGKDQLASLESGEYYWSDLIGLTVINEQGENLGKVHHLIETGSNDVLVIRGDISSIDQKERLVPYLPDQVVLHIDIDAQQMQVDWDSDF